ncbi:protein Hook homolog 3-like [Sycon ciliatum]|uniref:protein Hook homolog 3-like n=1 Tax=Sycon ciliatum TaxID=27933 RepID=UPI0031F6DB31
MSEASYPLDSSFMEQPHESQLNNLFLWIKQLVKDDSEGTCGSLEDLTDGLAISQSLHVLASDFFDEEWLTKISKKTSNWRVATNNIRKLTSKLQDYYEQVCQEELSDFDWPDPNAIGERKDMQQLCSLLQLVLGVVFCRKQEADIMQIQQLEQSVQKSIMDVFHELQKRLPTACFGLQESESTSDSNELLKTRLTEVCAANRKLEERNKQLEFERNSLEQEREALAADNQRLVTQQEQQQQQDVTDGPDTTNRLKVQLEELQQRVIELGSERDEAELARDQFRKSSERHEETIRQLRQQNHDLLEEVKDDTALQDELDILRRRVRDYETQVEKYKQKLDGLADIRHRLKVCEEERGRLEQQTRELEEKCRLSTAARSQLDHYRQKVEDLEESVSAEAKRAMEGELAARKAKEKLEQMQRQLKRTEEELAELRDQHTEAEALLQQQRHDSSSALLDQGDSNLEEVSKLKAEIDSLKSSSTAAADVQQHIDTLQSELRYRDEVEDKLRKQARKLQAEVVDLQSRLDDSESESRMTETKSQHTPTATATATSSDSSVVSDLKRTLADVRIQAKTLKGDLEQRNKKLEEKNAHCNSLKDKVAKKEEELLALHSKHKSFQEKTRSTIKVLQDNHERTLQREIQDRDKQLKDLQEYSKQQEEKTEKVREGYEMEQRVLISSWNRACEKLQHSASQSRLAGHTDSSFMTSALPASFLARQRQALVQQQTTASFTGVAPRTGATP